MLRYDVQIRRCLPQRNAGADACHNAPILPSVEAPDDLKLLRSPRHPKLRSTPGKSRRLNAHEHAGNTVQVKRLAKQGGISAKLIDTGFVAHDKNRWRPGLVVRRFERPP